MRAFDPLSIFLWVCAIEIVVAEALYGEINRTHRVHKVCEREGNVQIPNDDWGVYRKKSSFGKKTLETMTLTKFKQSQTLHNLPGAAQLDNDYMLYY